MRCDELETVRVIIAFYIIRKNGKKEMHDLDVPLNITVNDLIMGLNKAYRLGIDNDNIRNCYLKAEYPIALLRGNKNLSEFNIMNGTQITYTEV